MVINIFSKKRKSRNHFSKGDKIMVRRHGFQSFPLRTDAEA